METFFTGPQNLLQSQYHLNNSIGVRLHRNTSETEQKIQD